MIPRELTRRFVNGKGALFIGAGMSKGANLPDWDQLVKPLRRRMQLDEKQTYSPEQIAGWFELQFSRDVMMRSVRRRLQKTWEPTPCHKLLAALPVDLYFTTNFDTLLETVMVNADLVVDDVDFTKLDAPDRKQIIKVHGNLSKFDTMVFTKRDYDHYLEKRPAISDLIRLTLMQRTVLFLGYSFRDRNLTTILAQAGRRLGNSRHALYAVIFDATYYEKKELEENYGVTVIEPLRFPNEDKSVSMRRWLSRFAMHIDQARKGLNDGREVVRPSPLATHAGKLVGRQRDIDNVKRALLNMRFVVIEGASGVGKTALTIEVARQSEFGRAQRLNDQDRMFARTVYVDAGGYTDWSALYDHLLGRIAEDFGLAVVRHFDATRLQEKENQVRSLLQIFRVLLIVDSVAAAVRADLTNWLSHVPEPSAAIMVSRARTGETRAIHLNGLPSADAVTFLREGVGDKVCVAPDAIERLARSVGGNPQGMNMLLGQLVTPEVPVYAGQDDDGKGCERVLLHSWTYLGEPGRQVLKAAALFDTRPVSETALYEASGIESHEQFREALRVCKALMLLEADGSVRPFAIQESYRLHPRTAALARQALADCPDERNTMYRRLARHYHTFVRTVVERPDPPVPYWNALATQDMVEIDEEWPTIRRVLAWAVENDRAYVKPMLFLLVHYLDTRSLHQERIEFTRFVLQDAQDSGDRLTEALLRIDALGWTLIHQGNIDAARVEINRGLDALEDVDGKAVTELQALAHTWLTVTACLRDEMPDAKRSLRQALAAARGQKSWIRYRVYMVAGDVCAKRAKFRSAIACYNECRALVDSYGGEEGYQMLPRLGMACLLDEQLDQADKVFTELHHLSLSDRIEAGLLYARYGFAYLAAHREARRGIRRHEGALSQLEQLRGQLARATSSSLVHVLMDELQNRLKKMATS